MKKQLHQVGYFFALFCPIFASFRANCSDFALILNPPDAEGTARRMAYLLQKQAEYDAYNARPRATPSKRDSDLVHREFMDRLDQVMGDNPLKQSVRQRLAIADAKQLARASARHHAWTKGVYEPITRTISAIVEGAFEDIHGLRRQAYSDYLKSADKDSGVFLAGTRGPIPAAPFRQTKTQSQNTLSQQEDAMNARSFTPGSRTDSRLHSSGSIGVIHRPNLQSQSTHLTDNTRVSSQQLPRARSALSSSHSSSHMSELLNTNRSRIYGSNSAIPRTYTGITARVKTVDPCKRVLTKRIEENALIGRSSTLKSSTKLMLDPEDWSPQRLSSGMYGHYDENKRPSKHFTGRTRESHVYMDHYVDPNSFTFTSTGRILEVDDEFPIGKRVHGYPHKYMDTTRTVKHHSTNTIYDESDGPFTDYALRDVDDVRALTMQDTTTRRYRFDDSLRAGVGYDALATATQEWEKRKDSL